MSGQPWSNIALVHEVLISGPEAKYMTTRKVNHKPAPPSRRDRAMEIWLKSETEPGQTVFPIRITSHLCSAVCTKNPFVYLPVASYLPVSSNLPSAPYLPVSLTLAPIVTPHVYLPYINIVRLHEGGWKTGGVSQCLP
jgi:hypothetical protein